MAQLTIVMDPAQRRQYLDTLLDLDGLSHVSEDPNAAYCFISLTSTPDEAKPMTLQRQWVLADKVLNPAGITAYDPGSAPGSPDLGLTIQPDEIYRIDSMKLAGARYFVGHHLLPSDGKGIELEKAKTLNRMSVCLMDKGIRVSRMQPIRTIYLAYDQFETRADDFRAVFEMLHDYDPGMGFVGNLPVLVGFPKNGGSPVDLEAKVYGEFGHLQYQYDGKVPIAKLRLENPEVFYELQD